MIRRHKGFSLVEMALAVVILSVGITLIIRSFLTASSAIDSGENLASASWMLEERLVTEEAQAHLAAPQVLESEEDAKLANRPAKLRVHRNPIGPEGLEKTLFEIIVTLEWKEAGRPHTFSLGTWVRPAL
jgi:prepilin-type N-terminal cleavage/methylation domain-containing protein